MKLYKLEALRGFTAIYVVLHHSLPHNLNFLDLNFGVLLKFGQEAVILFFLLSGFVINYSFKRSSDRSFRTYFIKRFIRIYIPLLIIFMLGFLIQSMSDGRLVDPDLKNLAINLLMLQDIAYLKPNVIGEPYMHNAPLWSLSYEWWFYMLYFPIQKYIAPVKKQAICVFSLAAVFSLVYAFYYPGFVPRLLTYLSIWWTGVFLSNLAIDGVYIDYKSACIAIIGLSAVCISLILAAATFALSGNAGKIGAHPYLEARHHVFALLVLLFAIGWKKEEWIGFDFIFAKFQCLSPISYVIYISHQYLIVSASYLYFLNNVYFEWLGYLLFLIIFSWIIEVIVYKKLSKVFLRLTLRSTALCATTPIPHQQEMAIRRLQ